MTGSSGNGLGVVPAVDASSESFCGLGVEPPVVGAGVGRVTVVVPSLF